MALVPWLPTQLTTLKTWLKGDSNTGANGSAITTWSDASGVGNHATGVNSPTVAAANLNSLNTVRFTAVSNQSFSLPAGMFTGFTAGSVVFVVKLAADPTVANRDAGVTKFGPELAANSNNHYGFAGDNHIYDDFGSSARKDYGDPATSLAAWHITSFHAGNNDLRAYINGVSFYTSASNTVTWRTVGVPYIGQGARAGTINYLDGWLAELIFVNEVLSTSDRQKLEGYVAHKWGLQSVLNVAHPYKSEAPMVSVVDPPPSTDNYAGGGGVRRIRQFAPRKRKRDDEEEPIPVIGSTPVAAPPPPSAALPIIPSQPGLMAGIPAPPITVLRSPPVENEDDIEIALLLELLS